jgi:hypothetical protein
LKVFKDHCRGDLYLANDSNSGELQKLGFCISKLMDAVKRQAQCLLEAAER